MLSEPRQQLPHLIENPDQSRTCQPHMETDLADPLLRLMQQRPGQPLPAKQGGRLCSSYLECILARLLRDRQPGLADAGLHFM